MKKILVVYYSLSGHTARIAEAIATRCGADLEPIQETRPRGGIRGYLRAVWEALTGRSVAIQPPDRDPGDYEVVVIGTPVWAGRLTPAVRTYITDRADECRQVAFFCTEGGSGERSVFEQLRALSGQDPLATVAITERELKGGGYEARLPDFVTAIERALSPPAPVDQPEPHVRAWGHDRAG